MGKDRRVGGLGVTRARPIAKFAICNPRSRIIEPGSAIRRGPMKGINGKLFIVGIALLLCVASPPLVRAGAEGSVITWGTPTTISGDTDVRNDGSLVAAFNMNGNAVTVNGVPFASWTFPFMASTTTMGNFTITESPGHLLAYSNLGSASSPFSGLTSNYQTLLSSAVSSDDNNAISLTITGLTLGQHYEFQWWVNASQYNGTGSGFRTTASAPLSVSLDDNTSNAIGGVGQTVVGTFTAGDTSEIITFTGTDSTQAPTINAFQLRAVPEPSSLGLFVIGVALACIARRRNSV
jgi:hypothetical protein